MEIIFLVIGIVVGVAITALFYHYNLWTRYMDHGGDILLDESSGVYRIILNDDMADWGDEKYIILKVATAEKRLKRLEDIDPLEEDPNETE